MSDITPVIKRGFFSSTDLQNKQVQTSLIPKCGLCKLYETCNSPKMKISGKGKRKIFILGEGPGRNEDIQGRPFVGESGQLLQQILSRVGINMREDCWISNSVICWPWKKEKGSRKNRTPTKKEIDYCRPNVIRAIKELKPEIIVLLGKSAVRSLIGWLWKEEVGSISRWVGWQIPSQRLNAWVCPTWHPSHLLHSETEGDDEDSEGQGSEVLKLLFERHLENASQLTSRPYQTIPDFKSMTKRIINDVEASREVKKLMEMNKPLSFDYETNRLKPDHRDARIVCCSVSDGETSVAFPWQGKVVKTMKFFLDSNIPKIGYNALFETRWTKRELRVDVNNWIWDGMLAAHVLDNRKKITGLKFQSFVLLGQESYDDVVKPFFYTEGSNIENRIREVSLDKLLTYCAMDSLLEWKVAEIQMTQLDFSMEL